MRATRGGKLSVSAYRELSMLIDDGIFEFSETCFSWDYYRIERIHTPLMWVVPSTKGDEKVLSYLFQIHNELFTDHHTVSMSEYANQRAARMDADCPSHSGSMIVVACLLCLQLFCPNCLKDIRRCSFDNEWLYWFQHFGGFKTSGVK